MRKDILREDALSNAERRNAERRTRSSPPKHEDAEHVLVLSIVLCLVVGVDAAEAGDWVETAFARPGAGRGGG